MPPIVPVVKEHVVPDKLFRLVIFELFIVAVPDEIVVADKFVTFERVFPPSVDVVHVEVPTVNVVTAAVFIVKFFNPDIALLGSFIANIPAESEDKPTETFVADNVDTPDTLFDEIEILPEVIFVESKLPTPVIVLPEIVVILSTSLPIVMVFVSVATDVVSVVSAPDVVTVRLFDNISSVVILATPVRLLSKTVKAPDTIFVDDSSVRSLILFVDALMTPPPSSTPI
jgi:hypothetical protein